MGQNIDRLDRLRANRGNVFANTWRVVQTTQQKTVLDVTGDASTGVIRAARTEVFEGDLGEKIQAKLTSIQAQLQKFIVYQGKLRKAVEAANEALESTSSGTAGLPGTDLTDAQQHTIELAQKTNSPIQVSPGVFVAPDKAGQYYQAQAEAEQEEAARKMTEALDLRIQEIIDDMPTSDYDPPEPADEQPGGDDAGNGGTSDTPRVGGPGVTGTGTGTGTGTSQVDDPRGPKTGTDKEPPTVVVDPPRVVDPPTVVIDPPIIDPPFYKDPDVPNVDGGETGTIPNTPGPGGTGGVTPGGGSIGTVGGSAGAGSAGGLAGGALAGGAGLAGRVSGGALAGGLGKVGAAGGINAVGASGASTTGAAGGASGAAGAATAGGTRGGVVAGGAGAGGAARGSGKKNRRRGQDLFAYELEDDDEAVTPDLGDAGAAGSATSDGKEELGW
jgi:hypothetical protein